MFTKTIRRLPWISLVCVIALVSILFPVTPAYSAPAETVPVSAGNLDDVGDLEKFMDSVITSQMSKYHVPGVADKTLFRPASVSKLFVWTAVMQLVEQGKLSLNADVNEYLDTFQIPDTYPEPVTLRHLMTHTWNLMGIPWL